ncbi:MAG: hypothetical protein PHN57_05975, partial [Candidatus Omnitrophica bacterium]|nr:hypothetical protein [Candidatus Omnitrophota bacterium]
MKNKIPGATKSKGAFGAIFILCGILVLALAIRLYPVIKSPETLRSGMGQFGDSYLYNDIASNLYKNKGFVSSPISGAGGPEQTSFQPVVTRGPGYPF